MINSQNKIGLGLIGTGNIGKIHLMSIASLIKTGLVDVNVVALCDINEQTLMESAKLFDVPKKYRDFHDLVNDSHVDVVYICTPTNQHFEMVTAAAKAGKAIFCEKPLAQSCPQAQELLAVAQTAGVPNCVGLVLRYDPLLLYAKELLANHNFGKPMLAHIRDDQRFPVDYIYYSKWRDKKLIAGGGTLIEHSIHDIDILLWFFGKIKNVYARVGFYAEREVEDLAVLSMTHSNGAVSTLDSIWHWVERPNERLIEFFFEQGYIGIKLESGERYLVYQLQGEPPIKIDVNRATTTLIKKVGLSENDLSPEARDALTVIGPERYSALSYAFLTAIQSKQSPSPSFADAVSAHRIVDAAYESANLNRTVDIL